MLLLLDVELDSDQSISGDIPVGNDGIKAATNNERVSQFIWWLLHSRAE